MQGASKFDMVLMEPGSGGVAATCILRRSCDRTPIIAMATQTDFEDVDTYRQSGMNDVLPKTFTCLDMLSLLEKHLQYPNDQSPDRMGENLLGNEHFSSSTGAYGLDETPNVRTSCNVQHTRADIAFPLMQSQHFVGTVLWGNAIWDFIQLHERYCKGLDIVDVCTRLKKVATWLRGTALIRDVDIQRAISESVAAGAIHRTCCQQNRDEALLPTSEFLDSVERSASHDETCVRHKSNATTTPRSTLFICKLCIEPFGSPEDILRHGDVKHPALPNLDAYAIILISG